MLLKNRFLHFAISVVLFATMALIPSCGGKKTNETFESKKDAITQRIEQLEWEIKKDSKNAALYHERARLYLEKGQLSKAFVDISNALELDSKNVEYNLTLSDVYRAMGDYPKAAEAASRITVADPSNATAFLKLGEIRLLNQEFQLAFLNINRSIELQRNNPKAFFARGLGLLEIEDTANAIIAFRVVIDQEPDFYEAYMNLGFIHAARHSNLAIDYFQAAIDLKPEELSAIYSLAMYLQEHDEPLRAIQLYERMMEIDPSNAFAYYNTAYVYMVYLEEPLKAIPFFEKAIENKQDYLEAMYNLGLAYELSGDKAKARAQYQEVLRKKTNYDLAVEGLNRLDR